MITRDPDRLLRVFVKGGFDAVEAMVPLADSASDDGMAFLQRGIRFEVEHEPGVRADCIMQAVTQLPEELPGADQIDGGEWLRGRIGSRLYEQSADVVVLTLEPNVTHYAWRHRASGRLLDGPDGVQQRWPAETARWLAEQCSAEGLLEPTRFKQEFSAVIAGLRRAGTPTIVVLNCCSIDPADHIACYSAVAGDTNAVRVHRLNLALLELSATEGVSIIDIDRIVGELGADSHVSGFLNYSAQANEAIRHEFLRVIEDLGLLEIEPVAVCQEPDGSSTSARKVQFPFVHRLSEGGTIVRWYKQEGDAVSFGDDLLDIELRLVGWEVKGRDERIQTLIDHKQLQADEATPKPATAAQSQMLIRLSARESGVLQRIEASPGSLRAVGDVLGVIGHGAPEDERDGSVAAGNAGTFPVVVNNVL